MQGSGKGAEKEQMKTVLNKWNKKTYKVIKVTDVSVTLERADGSQFTINKKEYFSNYIEKSS